MEETFNVNPSSPLKAHPAMSGIIVPAIPES
jgi:hypothetical protein